MFAPSILSVEALFADTTNAALAQLWGISSMLLTNMSRAVASLIAPSKLRAALVAYRDITLRLCNCMTGG
jgi:hypothetical protein